MVSVTVVGAVEASLGTKAGSGSAESESLEVPQALSTVRDKAASIKEEWRFIIIKTGRNRRCER